MMHASGDAKFKNYDEAVLPEVPSGMWLELARRALRQVEGI
jgi:hypothetical protein